MIKDPKIITINSNPFHQAQYLLLNLAIGGINGGDPSQTTLTGNLIFVRNQSNEPTNVTIYQTMGRMVLNQIIGIKTKSIDVSKLWKGIYILQLNNKITKFIIP